MQTQPPDAPRILVVDDQQSLLDILQRWLARCGYEVHVAADGFAALSLAKEHRFDVIVTDLKMPGLNGLQLMALLKDQDPAVQVIFLTGQGTMQDAIEALREGRAFDFLQKPLRDLHELNQVIDKAMARRRQSDSAAQPRLSSACLEGLSPREREILTLLTHGMDNRAIASHMALSEKTIRNYLTRIYEKLGVASRMQALVVCKELGNS